MIKTTMLGYGIDETTPNKKSKNRLGIETPAKLKLFEIVFRPKQSLAK